MSIILSRRKESLIGYTVLMVMVDSMIGSIYIVDPSGFRRCQMDDRTGEITRLASA